MKKKFNEFSLASIPAAILALFPVFACPVCAAAYVGFISSVGLGFTLNNAVMLPILVILLGIAIWGFWANVKNAGTYQIFAQGIFGALFILLGQFYLTAKPILYFGAALLIWASYLNIKVRAACKIDLGIIENDSESASEVIRPAIFKKDALLFISCITIAILVSVILKENYGFGKHPIHTTYSIEDINHSNHDN